MKVYEAVKEHRPEERKEALQVIQYSSQEKPIQFLRLQFPFLAEAPYRVFQAALEDLDEAYQHFFHGAGFPQFKSKRGGDSFTEKDKALFDYNGQAIKLCKIGWARYFNSQKTSGHPVPCPLQKGEVVYPL